jgi:hypothetical protein
MAFIFAVKCFAFRTFDYRSDSVAERCITQKTTGTREPSFNKGLNVKIFRGRAFYAAPSLSRVTTKIVQAVIKLLTGRISLLLTLELFAKISVRITKENEKRSKGSNKEYLKTEY